jgi:Uma2 family endonuclease
MPKEYEFTEDEFLYPSSDDMTKAETDAHRKAVNDLIARLDARYADAPDVYVSGDIKVYWEKWNPYEVVVPDCFVVFGVPKGDRDKYLGWTEDKLPSVVLEVASREPSDTWLSSKCRVYERDWGVAEYFVFDPVSEEHGPPLRGFRRVRNRYVPIVLVNETLTSKALGITLSLADGRLLLRDAATDEPVLTPAEAEVARLRKELDALRKKQSP